MKEFKNLDLKEIYEELMETAHKLDKGEITAEEANKISKKANKRRKKLNKKIKEAIKLVKQDEKRNKT
ncbi:MAG: hypothetical protein KAX05_08980 [Bacteroidales bacterium]|nr:hypothetical protein [Bacteroidales bacterium]